MSQVLKTALWIKFIAVIVMFLISFSLNFLIASTIDPVIAFHLLIWGKPALVLAFIVLLNLLFQFPNRIPVPNIIPSTFLILSVLVFFDLGFLIWKYYDTIAPFMTFWVTYGILFAICIWNLQKYIRAFTVGIPD